ncbi:hypothetical protein VPH35_099032 [Triticum aestivum]
MAEEPSAKRDHGEMSDKSSNLVDVHIPDEKREYTKTLTASVIHPFYKGMKKNIDTQEDHKLWGISPLPDNLIEYTGVDAYAAYKSWDMIDLITNGSELAKEREAENFYDRPYCPF